MNKKKDLFWIILVMAVCLIVSKDIAFAEQQQSTLTPINSWTNQYTNHYVGYTMQMPALLQQEERDIDVRSRFFGDGLAIDIFYDDFNGRAENFSAYHYYGNKSLYRGYPFQVTAAYDKVISGKKAKILHYQRDKLSKVAGDKNYYASAEIPRTNKEVITVVMKSDQPIKDFDALLDSFSFVERKFFSPQKIKHNPSNRRLNPVAATYMKETFSPQSSTQFGIFEPSAPDYFLYLDSLEKRMEYRFTTLLKYKDMSTAVPYDALLEAKNRGRVVELTLQTTKADELERDTTLDILNGSYDDYFKKYAQELKRLEYPVLFRLNNEMNGDWCKYSAYHYGKDADIYVELYRYVFRTFQENGADNVIFVWNPNEISFPNFSWNHYMAYYPGDDYVDIVGLTGYNTGNYYRGERWRSFEEIYDPLYADYTARFNHPLMITEFGSASHGGDKVAWMRDMFTKMKKYDKIKLAIWWSGTDWDKEQNPARIYRIDESEDTVDVAKEGLRFFGGK